MLQAVSQVRGGGDGIALLAEQPESLERGLKVLEVGLRLTPELILDLVLKDATSRPVIALGEGADGVPGLLGRAVCVLAEVRRMRGLLEKLFRADAVSFAADPRMVLCARRIPDALLDSGGWFQSLGIELAETRALPVQGENRLVVIRAGGGPQGTPPAKDSDGVAAPRSVPDAQRPAMESPRNIPRLVPGARSTGTASLVDEAKKKILRIGDEIEEEVDGALVRFRLRDEILAVLETGDEVALALGDAPDLRRPISDRVALDSAVDDVVRRYFTLVRQARPRVLNGHAGTH
jgi:hypothetical protein